MHSGFLKVDWVLQGNPRCGQDTHKLMRNVTAIGQSDGNYLHVRVSDVIFVRTWDSVADLMTGITCHFETIHTEVNEWSAAPCANPNCSGLPNECNLNNMAPFYEITVENLVTRQTGEEPYLQFMVHPDERERMQRVLNGTDNPMWDYVHELRYNPDIGTHPVTKRIKI